MILYILYARIHSYTHINVLTTHRNTHTHNDYYTNFKGILESG